MLDTIEDAIHAIKNGEIIIVVDDETRENEGDMVCAAECVTPEIINFMAKHARGLICVPLEEERCEKLGLDLMVGKNTSMHETPFTVSVDLLGHGNTTGISAYDRSNTIKALVNPETRSEELAKPGHVFPLKAKKGGVLRRTGHTEAVVDFASLAGFKPAGVLVEILKEDGTMARLPDLRAVANQFNLKLVSINDLIQYRLQFDTLIKRELVTDMPTKWGHFDMYVYRQLDTDEVHLALVKGQWTEDETILVRVHAANIIGDIFNSTINLTGPLLKASMERVEKAGKGVVLYMLQENSGTKLLDKLKAYKQKENQPDEAKKELNLKMDDKDFGVGAQILKDLNISKINLITNNPKKRVGLMGYGLEIVDNVYIDDKVLEKI